MGQRDEIPTFEALSDAAELAGVACRGGFHPLPEDGVPPMADGAPARTVVLFGFTGGEQWSGFEASTERRDGAPHPLDRWSRRVIGELANRYGARDLYPAPGPPWWPFQRWARRAEALHVSPLGILIHPVYGLWHAYRGALAFRTVVSVPRPQAWADPCAACQGKPCLHHCPVGAVRPGDFDSAACGAHVSSPGGGLCRTQGCRARLSCPVGARYRYGAGQSAFHMASLGYADGP